MSDVSGDLANRRLNDNLHLTALGVGTPAAAGAALELTHNANYLLPAQQSEATRSRSSSACSYRPTLLPAPRPGQNIWVGRGWPLPFPPVVSPLPSDVSAPSLYLLREQKKESVHFQETEFQISGCELVPVGQAVRSIYTGWIKKVNSCTVMDISKARQ